MSFIRSLASKRRLRLVSLILFLGEIMPLCFYYMEKKLFYIAILVSFSRQPSFYTKCIKLNMRLSCNIRSVFNAKCIYFIRFCVL